MSVANPLWEAPRSHGELLKLGVDVGQTTVATIVTPKVLLVPTKFVLAAVQVTLAVQAAQKPDNQDNRDWDPN
jgi:hypothetical protein